MHPLPVRTLLATAAVAAIGLIGAASASAAATFGCSASAARITVLGTSTIEPTTANVGNPICASATSTLSDPLNGLNPAAALLKPLSASAVSAYTTVSDGGSDPTKAGALAGGGIADLTVSALPSIPGLSIDQITAPVSAVVGGVTTQLNQISVPLPSTVTDVMTLLGITPTTVTADATQAVQALVPTARALTTTPLLNVQAAMAYATAACQNGVPTVSGVSRLAGVSIAGQAVPTDQAVTRSVSLLPVSSVDFSTADPTKVVLSANATALLNASPTLLVLQGALDAAKAALNTAVTNAVTPVLKALPVVSVPQIAASVSLVPGALTRNGDSVVQQALTLSASVGVVDTATGLLTKTVKLADAVIGEAKASQAGLDCVIPASANPGTPAGATLQCSTRKLVLVDVLQVGNRVRLNGVANSKYVGKTVDIVFGATGQTVAHAVVGKDGTFRTTAPLPGVGIRDTNRARYTAKIGGERSLDLKLRRRMIVRSMASRNGKVTIAGRVVPPLGRPVKPIVISQRVSCGHDKVVGRFMPDRHGNFRVTVSQPTQGTTAVYRLSTFVRPSARSHRLSPTFTLPRAVVLHH